MTKLKKTQNGTKFNNSKCDKSPNVTKKCEKKEKKYDKTQKLKM